MAGPEWADGWNDGWGDGQTPVTDCRPGQVDRSSFSTATCLRIGAVGRGGGGDRGEGDPDPKEVGEEPEDIIVIVIEI